MALGRACGFATRLELWPSRCHSGGRVVSTAVSVAALATLLATCASGDTEQVGNVAVIEREELQSALQEYANSSLASIDIDPGDVSILRFEPFVSTAARRLLPTDCVGGVWPDSTYAGAAYYCPDRARVVWDTLLGAQDGTQVGMLEVLVVSHEVGHHYEHHAFGALPRSGRLVEEVADCFSGAFMSELPAIEDVGVRDPAALESLFLALPIGHSRDGGSKRWPAFLRGWERGLGGCSVASLSALFE